MNYSAFRTPTTMACINRVMECIKEEAKSSDAIAEQLGLHTATVLGYIKYLADMNELHVARFELREGRGKKYYAPQYKAGFGQNAVRPSVRLKPPKGSTAIKKQVGNIFRHEVFQKVGKKDPPIEIRRDPLVAALFGAAK